MQSLNGVSRRLMRAQTRHFLTKIHTSPPPARYSAIKRTAQRFRNITPSRRPLRSNAHRNIFTLHARSQPPVPTITTRGRSSRHWGFYLVGGATAVYLGARFLEWKRGVQVVGLEGDENTLVGKENMLGMKEPPAFVHPYESKHWVEKLYIRAKRTLFLAAIFAPCALLYGFAELTESEAWREFWIRILVSTVEVSGCSVQKFAQWCSMRPDMFPKDIVDALSKLRSEAPAHEFEHTCKEIKRSFGRELEDIFDEFEKDPVASGTVAQVHRARLKKEYAIDGKIRDVAVKVQHPHVLEETFCDVDLLFQFIKIVSSKLTMPMDKNEFMMVLQRQTNFEWEAYNLQRFAANFKSESLNKQNERTQNIKFPDVCLDFLSPSVLIESWAPGRTISKFFHDTTRNLQQTVQRVQSAASVCLEENGREMKKELARTIFHMNMKMFLRDNLIHSDMHAGNILFSEETGDVTVLDAGQTASLDTEIAPKFARFLHAICQRDADSISESLLEFDTGHGHGIETKTFRKDVQKALDEHAPEGEIVVVGDVMGDIFFTLSRHNMHLRSDVSVSLMSMAVSEGLIRSLDPDFDLIASALPYVAKYGLFNGA